MKSDNKITYIYHVFIEIKFGWLMAAPRQLGPSLLGLSTFTGKSCHRLSYTVKPLFSRGLGTRNPREKQKTA